MIKTKKNQGLGIAAGVGTGVFWGLPFLVPQVLPHYTSLEIAFGRFVFFGVISAFFSGKVWKVLRLLSPRDRFFLFLLSASGFWLYSILLFFGVHETGGVVSSLVIGLLPITIPLFTPERKNGGARFYGGLLCLGVGLLNLFGYPLYKGLKSLDAPSSLGVLSLIVCLGLWTWFAISNSRFLRRHPELSRKDFTSVMGLISLLSILPFFFLKVNPAEMVGRPDFARFLFCSAALGLGASWLANWLWNICSFHCPSEISGPLIVSETIFGLLYSFIFGNRMPLAYELASILLFLLGVFLAVSAQMRPDPEALL